jgi:hypothetical protein
MTLKLQELFTTFEIYIGGENIEITNRKNVILEVMNHLDYF